LAFEEYLKTLKLDCEIDSIDNSKNDRKLEKLNKEISSLENKRKRIQKLFINEEINSTDYKELLEDIDNQKSIINSSINSIKDEQVSAIDYSQIKGILTNVKLNWDYLDTEQRKAFINQFIDHITIDVNNGNVIIKELNFC
jgi:hypothetical protein